MNWQNLSEDDWFLFARAYRTAARKLAGMLDAEPGPSAEFDAAPVLSAYRHAIELHLKLIVLGDGSNFLKTKPDEVSVHKTRSLSWLAQFVVQIVTALKWEGEFKAAGIEDLAAFKSLIEAVNSIDPAFHSFRYPTGLDRPEMSRRAVLDFVGRLDNLVELLEGTADALSVEWDLRSGRIALDPDWPCGKPTIQ